MPKFGPKTARGGAFDDHARTPSVGRLPPWVWGRVFWHFGGSARARWVAPTKTSQISGGGARIFDTPTRVSRTVFVGNANPPSSDTLGVRGSRFPHSLTKLEIGVMLEQKATFSLTRTTSLTMKIRCYCTVPYGGVFPLIFSLGFSTTFYFPLP